MFFIRRNWYNLIRFVNISKSSSRNTSFAQKPILYGDEASPPVRFVMMTASMLNIGFEFYKIDLFKQENKSDFYKKINPLQKVPVLSIDNEVIRDSHAIALHLCRISNDNQLYPQENITKTKIDEMMYFNSGVLFPIDSAVFSEFFAGQPTDETKVNNWYTALDHLELQLSESVFLVGNEMRLCDLCCGATVDSLELLVPLLQRHKKIKNWLENLRQIPCSEINNRGLNRLQELIKTVRYLQND